MSDRSFVRFGGLAATLLALTSWLAVAAYYLLARGGQDEVGLEMYEMLVALAAVWSLFAVIAVHWTLRAGGEAWSLFALIVGVAAAFASLTASIYPIAFTRAVLARPLDPTRPLPVAVSATDPLGVVSLGAMGCWFLVAGLLLWRGSPRLLAALSFIAAAALLFALFGALGAQAAAVTLGVTVGGAVAAPLFWLWMGIRLRRSV